MNEITLSIDGQAVKAKAGTTVIQTAREMGIYIPALCDHPDLKPTGQCGICVVEIEASDEFPLACTTEVAEGMVVRTDTPEVQRRRQEALEHILTEHPHACVECWRRERCKPFDICLRNVSVSEHCVTCPKNGHCELQRVVDYVSISADIPYRSKGYAVVRDNPFFDRDYNLCIVCTRCVRVCRDVRGVGVYVLDDEENPTKVLTAQGGSVKDSGCKFCFSCVEVCPTGAIMDREAREKLYVDRDAYIVPCSHACPAHIDIPRYIDYIARGQYGEALALIREKVPFPGSLGRVCIHPCETACRRSQLNDPIAIKELKRTAADRGGEEWKSNSKVSEPTGKRIAVVGAGPAGLTAAYYLAKRGHSVTVFEALPVPGGMMRVGIPEYRLPRDILNGEIQVIQEAGVEIRTNTRVESVDWLVKQGYDAVLLGIGAHQGMTMGVEGEDTPGVMDGASFLREVNLGREVRLGNQVAVIGGGNAAIDSARVAQRVGAKEVTLIYRRTRAEMPASPEEVEAALPENISIMFLAAPSKVTRKNGALELECIRMRLGKPDASGRRRPEPIPDSEFTIELDSVIAAIGQVPEITSEFGVKIGRGNTLQVDRKTLQTSMEGVFAAGDAVTGPASVIEAIASGRQAATYIDRYLGGSGDIEEALAPVEEADGWLGKEEGFADRQRVHMPCLSVEQRSGSFAEVELGLTEEMAVGEAKQCLRCNLRLQITPPMLPPIGLSARKALSVV
jgi:NADPH-dependent glutamate synthase beta subunit-like oxidoreductase/ferredoxin